MKSLKETKPARVKPAGVIACAIAALLVVVACLLPTPHLQAADQQGMPTTFTAATNMPPTVTATYGSNTVKCFFPVRQGRGAGLQVSCKGSTGWTNCIILLSPSVDGTNITAPNTWWNWSCAGSGTNEYTYTTNWARGALDGITALVLVGVTNNSTSGTWTNMGALWNTPNN